MTERELLEDIRALLLLQLAHACRRSGLQSEALPDVIPEDGIEKLEFRGEQVWRTTPHWEFQRATALLKAFKEQFTTADP